MPNHKWTDEFVTGIEDIDRQHRKIFEFVQRLEQPINEKNLRVLILEINSYLAFHFRFEENLLEDAEYQFLRAHKKVHMLMTKRLNDINQRFRRGDDVVADLSTLLNSWVYNHILNDDAAYLPTIRLYMQSVPTATTYTRWKAWLAGIYRAIRGIKP